MKPREGFAVAGRIYTQGDDIPEDDPVVAGREHLFVERATAAPGEKRSVPKRKKKKPAATTTTSSGGKTTTPTTTTSGGK